MEILFKVSGTKFSIFKFKMEFLWGGGPPSLLTRMSLFLTRKQLGFPIIKTNSCSFFEGFLKNNAVHCQWCECIVIFFPIFSHLPTVISIDISPLVTMTKILLISTKINKDY